MSSPRKIGKSLKKYMRLASMEGTVERTRSFSSMRSRSGNLSSPSSPAGSNRGSPSSSRSWERGNHCSDSDEDAPSDVPEGSLAVYVGSERRRFVIQTKFLYKQVFRVLLKQSEEEFGYETQGGLRIACEVELFETLLWRLETVSNS